MKYRIVEDVPFSRIQDEIILMDVQGGEYINLDAIGSRIWDLLATTPELDELTRILLDEYQVEPEQCRAEIAEFLDDLLARGLICQVDSDELA